MKNRVRFQFSLHLREVWGGSLLLLLIATAINAQDLRFSTFDTRIAHRYSSQTMTQLKAEGRNDVIWQEDIRLVLPICDDTMLQTKLQQLLMNEQSPEDYKRGSNDEYSALQRSATITFYNGAYLSGINRFDARRPLTNEPLSAKQAFLFDLQQQKLLTLDELFADSLQARQTLQNLLKTHLPAQPAIAMSGDTLLIMDSIAEHRIPIMTLRNLLKEDYQDLLPWANNQHINDFCDELQKEKLRNYSMVGQTLMGTDEAYGINYIVAITKANPGLKNRQPRRLYLGDEQLALINEVPGKLARRRALTAGQWLQQMQGDSLTVALLEESIPAMEWRRILNSQKTLPQKTALIERVLPAIGQFRQMQQETPQTDDGYYILQDEMHLAIDRDNKVQQVLQAITHSRQLQQDALHIQQDFDSLDAELRQACLGLLSGRQLTPETYVEAEEEDLEIMNPLLLQFKERLVDHKPFDTLLHNMQSIAQRGEEYTDVTSAYVKNWTSYQLIPTFSNKQQFEDYLQLLSNVQAEQDIVQQFISLRAEAEQLRQQATDQSKKHALRRLWEMLSSSLDLQWKKGNSNGNPDLQNAQQNVTHIKGEIAILNSYIRQVETDAKTFIKLTKDCGDAATLRDFCR